MATGKVSNTLLHLFKDKLMRNTAKRDPTNLTTAGPYGNPAPDPGLEDFLARREEVEDDWDFLKYEARHLNPEARSAYEQIEDEDELIEVLRGAKRVGRPLHTLPEPEVNQFFIDYINARNSQ